MESAQTGFQTAVLDWEDGYRRVQATGTDAEHKRMLGRVLTAVEDELRKRLGSRFTVSELVGLYREWGDVLCDVGMATVPPGADLTDVSAACDAAFYLYMREAVDFAGGRPMRVSRAG